MQFIDLVYIFFYSYPKFILNVMPFKSGDEKNVFSYTFHHALGGIPLVVSYFYGERKARKIERKLT